MNEAQKREVFRNQPSREATVGKPYVHDFLVIGAGIAGMTLALRLAQLGHVALVCKDALMESNTRYAQGGIAAVMHPSDSIESHVQDTLNAGAGLCHENIVRKVIEEGPASVKWLIELGVPFTKNNNDNDSEFHLTREGAHSARRVLHVDDLTGNSIQKTLIEKVLQHPHIEVFEYHTAIDLIVTDKVQPDFSRNRCLGAYILNSQKSTIHCFTARATSIATGGHGKVYLYTSNPDIATGDGVAIAKRAGARVANLEFMQFHPTCLFSPLARDFLISEALRGEGAILLSRSGERFMEKIDPRKELAPRDIVARAIDAEMKRSGAQHVFLDINHKGSDFIIEHFPNIYQKCLEVGINITREPIPVVPAAHFSCGGIVTDSRGRTGIKSLWALGEAACTGLHGANRLASNSLLEGLVFSKFVADDIKSLLPDLQRYVLPSIPDWHLGKACAPDEMVVVSQLWDEIRRIMWNYVGIVRTDKRLERAAARIRQIVDEIETYYWNVVPSRDLLEVRNLALIAMLTVKCARLRKESRGIHYSLDYPSQTAYFCRDTVLS